MVRLAYNLILPILGLVFLFSVQQIPELPKISALIIAGLVVQFILLKLFAKKADIDAKSSKFEKLWFNRSIMFALGIVTVAVCTFYYWKKNSTDLNVAYLTAAALLMISAPFCLWLSSFLSVRVGASQLQKLGIGFRSLDSLEKISDINVITFDKSGTVTRGTPQIQKMKAVENFSHKDLLHLAASVEQNSDHPYAVALKSKAREENLNLLKLNDSQVASGKGVSGKIERDGKTMSVCVGNLIWFFDNDYDSTKIPGELLWEAEGTNDSVLWVGVDQKFVGVIILEDSLQPAAKETFQKLSDEGFELGLITGDTENPAKAISKDLKLKFYHFGVVGDEKATLIKRLGLPKKKGLDMVTDRVAFIGDGRVEHKAFHAATVGISMGPSDEADVQISSRGIHQVPQLFHAINRMNSLTTQNLVVSFLYHLIVFPFAAGAFIPKFELAPSLTVAAAIVTLPGVLIIANSLRSLSSCVDERK